VWVKVGVLVGAVLALVAAYACLVVVGMRTKSRGALRVVRRVNRAVINPLQLRSAGQPGAYASIIRHRGRVSGRLYENPVGAERTDDGFVIALPYGTSTDWLRNLLAAGTATVVHGGETFEVDHPVVGPLADEIDHFSAADRRNFPRFGVSDCVRVRIVGPSLPA